MNEIKYIKQIKTDNPEITLEIVEKNLHSKRYEIHDDLRKHYILIRDKRKHKIGIAWCHPKDTYYFEIGIIVAWCKLKGIPIPDIKVYKTLGMMKSGTKFIDPFDKELIFQFIGKDPTDNSFIVQEDQTSNPDEYFIIRPNEKCYNILFEVVTTRED